MVDKKEAAIPISLIADLKSKFNRLIILSCNNLLFIQGELEEQNRQITNFVPQLEQKSRQFFNADGSIKSVGAYTCESTKKQQETFALNTIKLLNDGCNVLKPEQVAVGTEFLDITGFVSNNQQ